MIDHRCYWCWIIRSYLSAINACDIRVVARNNRCFNWLIRMFFRIPSRLAGCLVGITSKRKVILDARFRCLIASTHVVDDLAAWNLVSRDNWCVNNLSIPVRSSRRYAAFWLIIAFNIRSFGCRRLGWVIWIILIRWSFRARNWITGWVNRNDLAHWLIGNCYRWIWIIRGYLSTINACNIRVVARDNRRLNWFVGMGFLIPSRYISCLIALAGKRIIILDIVLRR